jgi:hypothetical protein
MATVVLAEDVLPNLIAEYVNLATPVQLIAATWGIFRTTDVHTTLIAAAAVAVRQDLRAKLRAIVTVHRFQLHNLATADRLTVIVQPVQLNKT